MLPTDPKARKNVPIATGVLDYFPDALAAVAEVSRIGNEQHNPGKPLHWDRSKSTDEADALMRHFVERGTIDSDGSRHSAKVAWRALALLQKEIEAARLDAALDECFPDLDADKDGWIKWAGGEISQDDYDSVPPGLSRKAQVEVRFSDGEQDSGSADAFYWYHDGRGSNIVAYKVIEGKDGWIEWDGGNIVAGNYTTIPPFLNRETKVEVKLRNGHFVTRPAQDFAWWHDNTSGDIVAYKVVD